MKLLTDLTTPFGRKVVVAALERSISLEEVFVPLDGSGPLDRWNPLRQLPALVIDDKRSVYDSDVILQYLDSCHTMAPLFPEHDRIEVLTRTALGSGLIEATLLRRMEVIRPEQEQSRSFIERLEARIERALRALEAELHAMDKMSGPLRADQITAGCALGYLDLRFNESWRVRCAALASWYAKVGQRRSFVLSSPTRAGPVPRSEFAPR